MGNSIIISGYENMDLTTPNRLRLRRSNDCTLAARMEVTGNPDTILKENSNPGRYLMCRD